MNKSTAVLVKKSLMSSEKARDNDRMIHTAIWMHEAKTLGLEGTREFLNAYFHGKLTDPNSISRVRRKLQELYPELRGEKYTTRQEKYQDDAKAKVKKIK